MISINFKTPVKKCFNSVKCIISSSGERVEEISPLCQNILGEQNKVLHNIPSGTGKEFKSTKELLKYTKEKCLSSINCDKPYEYTVVADGHKNIVLAEYVGDAGKCGLSGIDRLPINSRDTLVIHSHPEGYPLSVRDVAFLLDYPVNQVIAFDKNGKFSMVAKRVDKIKTDRLY